MTTTTTMTKDDNNITQKEKKELREKKRRHLEITAKKIVTTDIKPTRQLKWSAVCFVKQKIKEPEMANK